jgi:hypothetical protein
MTRATVVIRSAPDRAKVCRWAQNVEPGTVIEFRKARRTLDQNAKLWAMLTDISQQVLWHGQTLSPEDWKTIATASLRKCRFVPGMDPGTVVPLGLRTSDMTKAEMAELIELLFAFGAEREVHWSDEDAAGI